MGGESREFAGDEPRRYMGGGGANVAPPFMGGEWFEDAGDEPRRYTCYYGTRPMSDEKTRYKTWGRSRSVRLAGFDYRDHAAVHVTVCAKSGTRPFTDSALAVMVCETLEGICDKCGAYVGAFCLMPDHLHVLLSPDRSGLALGDVIGRIKGLTTKRSWALGFSGTLWQARFHDHIVRKSEGVVPVARYIYENPDRKGLAIEYPYRFVDGSLA